MIREVVEYVNVQYPVLDHQEKIANIGVEVKSAKGKIGIPLEESVGAMLFILNKGKTSGFIVNGDEDDILIQVNTGVSVIRISDLKEYINEDNYLYISFAKNFDGEYFVVGRYAGSCRRVV